MNEQTKPERKELKERLYYEVMEDYIRVAELGFYAKDQKRHMEEMRGYLDKLVSFITQLLAEERKQTAECVETALKLERKRIKMLIVEEINIAHSENQRTSRLTSLYNKI